MSSAKAKVSIPVILLSGNYMKMTEHIFETRYCKALALQRRGRARLALSEIEDILEAIGENPETKSEQAWHLMCRNEKASLLYDLGRENEARKLANKSQKIDGGFGSKGEGPPLCSKARSALAHRNRHRGRSGAA
jgi:hypothetical protein